MARFNTATQEPGDQGFVEPNSNLSELSQPREFINIPDEDRTELINDVDQSLSEYSDPDYLQLDETGKRSYVLYKMILEICENYDNQFEDSAKFAAMWNQLGDVERGETFTSLIEDMFRLEHELAATS